MHSEKGLTRVTRFLPFVKHEKYSTVVWTKKDPELNCVLRHAMNPTSPPLAIRRSISEAIEKHGDLPIPIELNSMGLQIDPPFSGPIRGSYNLSRLLGRMHRHAVMGKFLFDSKVFVGPGG
ncbi:hypothetical protein ACFE04_004060 [Oxalis oulophora]